jgi:hypothetical protein
MSAQYCDHCGEVITGVEVWYARLPFSVASANAGESACLCNPCAGELSLKSATEYQSGLKTGDEFAGERTSAWMEDVTDVTAREVVYRCTL